MNPNPPLGVLFHWMGGLASGSFYVPFRSVKKWSWETAWLFGGVFSWILAPFVLGMVMTHNLPQVLREAPRSTIFWCYVFGALWGVGGLTYGLTVRYLGMSLGVSLALGYCAVFGTLMPPIFNGEFASKVLGTRAGQVILAGIGVCVMGIVAAALAGLSKEKELGADQKTEVIVEFNLKKGLVIATVCGIMSACFSYGLAAGGPIREITMRHGTPGLWQGLPVLVVILLGGFTTNLFWCIGMNVRNRTGAQYLHPTLREVGLCALAGTLWYFQFFFYTMGETQMGVYRFSSWTLHMASIMIFGSLWGVALKEWRGASAHTMRLLALSLFLLIASTLVVGYGNYMSVTQAATRP